MKIVVLAAGTSTEREVSIVSGTEVCKALRSRGHQAILVDVFFGKEGADPATAFDGDYDVDAEAAYISSFNAQVKDAVASGREFFGPGVIELCKAADVVFMALHGENGENGKIQAAFDLFGIRYTGTGYLGSALAMDKNIAKQFFVANGIPTPGGIRMKRDEQIRDFAKTGLNLPCVVKPCCGGSSIGVSIVRTVEEDEAALEEAFRWEEEILIEDYIEGREFSVGVLEGKALPIIEIAPVEGFYDYKNKYKAGSAVETCPAQLSEAVTKQMQQYAVEVTKALGLGAYSRMDFLLDSDEKMYCLEANTLPGMTPTSLLPQEAQAVGVSFEQLCEKLIELSLKKYA